MVKRTKQTTRYRIPRVSSVIFKQPRDDLQVLRDQGMTYKEISNTMNGRMFRISPSSVRRFLLRKEKKVKPYSPRSIPLHLHEGVKSLVDELYEESNTQTTQEIIDQVEAKMNVKIKKDVVANIRAELGLYQHRVRYGHAVRIVNRLLRIIYIEKKLEEGEQFLIHSFSDESYFVLGKTSSHCFVRSRAAAIKQAPKYAAKVLVWGAISVRGPSPCVILSGKNAIINGGAYQAILHKTFVEWNRETFGGIGVLVQDAAPCHVSRSTRLYFERTGIEVEEWPPESPDLNPIETVWALMKNWVNRHWKPTDLEHLKEGIQYYWNNKLTPEMCQNLIGRVQQKMREVLAKRGEPCPD